METDKRIKRTIKKANQRYRRKKQRGGAVYRRKPRLVDKIAQGASVFLAGPAPTFTTAFGKLDSQALKGVTDNVKYYKRRGRGRR